MTSERFRRRCHLDPSAGAFANAVVRRVGSRCVGYRWIARRPVEAGYRPGIPRHRGIRANRCGRHRAGRAGVGRHRTVADRVYPVCSGSGLVRPDRCGCRRRLAPARLPRIRSGYQRSLFRIVLRRRVFRCGRRRHRRRSPHRLPAQPWLAALRAIVPPPAARHLRPAGLLPSPPSALAQVVKQRCGDRDRDQQYQTECQAAHAASA